MRNIIILAIFLIFGQNFVVQAQEIDRRLPGIRYRVDKNHPGAYDDIDEVRKRKNPPPRFHHRHRRPNLRRKIDSLPKVKRKEALDEIRRHRAKMRGILGDRARDFRDEDFI